ncbi:efflux RND transporter periplasmic adaptor subunit [Xanthobacter sp. TB0139]|uniref:efflux RND transporter periplasmic adaptor subunit n=1 Tax=Xanthobacter sp. TB0139 TaxID=3459178 RepID=UPI004039F62D
MRWAALAATTLLVAACGEEKNTYVPPPPPEVTVAPVLNQPVTRFLEFTGNTASINEVDLNARVQGYLRSINYTDGQAVKKGTVLFVIEQDNYKANVEQAKATLDAAQAQQVQAEAEFNRQNQLAAKDFASQAVLDVARAKRDAAIANVENAKASLELSQIQLGYTEVTAPFDGVVSAHLQDVGALVGYDGPTKLASIVQLDPIYVWFTVNEQQALRLQEGMQQAGSALSTLRKDPSIVPVEIGMQTDQGFPYSGHLDYIAPQIDPNLGTLSMRGLFANKNMQLLPGLFTRVRVPLGKPTDTILIPESALSSNQQGFYVLSVNAENVVAQTYVTLGQLQPDGLRALEGGLKAGDRIIIGGLQRAVPGSKVTPKDSVIKGVEVKKAPAEKTITIDEAASAGKPAADAPAATPSSPDASASQN